MTIPWFLELLALDADADGRAIKRAYAVLLKQADPAGDPAGFGRLREAYECARAWAAQPPPPQSVERPALAPANVDVPPRAPVITPALDAVPAPTPVLEPTTPLAPLPPSAARPRPVMEDPATLAQRVIKRFTLRVKYDKKLDIPAELEAGTIELRKHHIDAAFLYERMLVDALSGATLRRRAEVFAAAYDYFGWREYLHLASLGPGGGWIDHVDRERQAFNRMDARKRSELIHWLSTYTEEPSRIPDDVTLKWPQVRDALAQYPHYLGLYVSDEARATWNSRYVVAAANAEHHAQDEAERMRQYKARRQRNEPERSSSGSRLAAVACMMLIGLFARLLTPHAPTFQDAGSRTPAVPHIPGRNDVERSQAYVCMRTVDQLSAPDTQPTSEQATELRKCRLMLDQMYRAEAASQ